VYDEIDMQEAYTQCYESAGKEVRNTVLTIILFLAEDKGFCKVMQTRGLLHLLLKATLSPDLETPSKHGITNFSVITDAAAFEQQQILWNILIVMCEKSTNCCREIMRLRFMDLLLLYVDVPASSIQVPSFPVNASHDCS
jgi:hypothetical protein